MIFNNLLVCIDLYIVPCLYEKSIMIINEFLNYFYDGGPLDKVDIYQLCTVQQRRGTGDFVNSVCSIYMNDVYYNNWGMRKDRNIDILGP